MYIISEYKVIAISLPIFSAKAVSDVERTLSVSDSHGDVNIAITSALYGSVKINMPPSCISIDSTPVMPRVIASTRTLPKSCAVNFSALTISSMKPAHFNALDIVLSSHFRNLVGDLNLIVHI